MRGAMLPRISGCPSISLYKWRYWTRSVRANERGLVTMRGQHYNKTVVLIENRRENIMRIRKILSKFVAFVVGLTFVVTPLAAMPAYADETPTTISAFTATSNTASLPVYGGTIACPDFNITAGEPAFVSTNPSSTIWLKQNEEGKWEKQIGTFTDGKRRL